MDGQANPPRVYRRPWRLASSIRAVLLIAAVVVVVFVDVSLEKDRILVIGVWVALAHSVIGTIGDLLAPRRMVLQERTLTVHWIWRSEDVPTKDIRLKDTDRGQSLSLEYPGRKLEFYTAEGWCAGLRTELLLRGSQVMSSRESHKRRASRNDPAA